MMNVLNKRWLSQGWHVMNPKDSETMALVWIESLDEHRIPYEHYHALYKRAVGLRAKRFEQGMKCDDFSVDLMIACWLALAEDLRQERIKSGRVLPSIARSDCDLCFGTGFESVPGKGARRCECRNV